MLDHAYNIIIDRSVGAPDNSKGVIDGMSVIEKNIHQC